MLYINYDASIGNTESSGNATTTSNTDNSNLSNSDPNSSSSTSSSTSTAVVEDEIDQQLNKQDGLILRKRDPIL